MFRHYIYILFILPVWANAQIITTIVGSGLSASTGDGGAASLASIKTTGLIVFDSLGNYYFGEYPGKVRKVSTAGIITTIAGTGVAGNSGDGGPATAARLNLVGGLAFDRTGNLYFADENNENVRKLDMASGVITTVVGTGSSGFSGDGGPATSAKLYEPVGIGFDSHGNLYIGDAGNFRIRRVDTSGIITTYAGTGSAGWAGDGGVAATAQLQGIESIYIDEFDNLFNAESGKIRKINLVSGIISSIAGNGTIGYSGDGGPATAATMWASLSALPDNYGNIYFSEQSNNIVRKVDASGIISTFAGTGAGGYRGGTAGFGGDGGPPSAAQLYYPRGIAFDQCGNLSILDVANYRIRKVTFPGTTTATIAITPSPTDTLCPGMAVTFNATIHLGGSSPAYQWLVNGSAVGTGASYTYVPSAGDSVQCELTSSSPCAVPATVYSNVVHMVPRNLAVTLSGPGVAATGSPVAITAAVSGVDTGYTIKWYNHRSYFSTTTIPSVTYTKPTGTDSITAKLLLTTADCTDSAWSAVHVVVDSVTAVTNVAGALGGVHLYPDPVKDVLFFESVERIQDIEIYNIVGALVARASPAAADHRLSVSFLQSGLYFVKVDGLFVGRFVKE